MSQGIGGARKSAAALSVVPRVLERVERLKPPEVLDIEASAVWVGIVNGHPADWFDAGAVPLLTQLCRHVVITNRIDAMIGQVGNNATMLNLLNVQRLESDCIRKISTSLRLTPQSLINHNANKNKSQSSNIHTPWSRANAG